ncbi:deoxyguanosinetriphosphate triphosphohydrolase [Altibacter sp. HG106]|uniref:deoxyguanosinetriphosphate triphosphohydrolase n=1 Tax=Altibacter sp. HG106 TaxID=3023937 RepID=UPI0023507F8F|nr:deoxyguanosinetriphosphate triphosphohydrolase [Altibacter sp. HG106]MDC7994765.1 deoxyguanosinetriphosphate triphosphohydrolase [Altibacter sp. HG106]
MQWEQLLSLKRQGDANKRLRIEQDETRLGFEVDYDRIIFSSSFRSLQDKTQVIPLSKTSFVHTRLTHSLEVSVVGRSLGRATGTAILERHPHLVSTLGYRFNDFGAIVAAASLAHDIGNPPFGHSGEKAIGDFFRNGNGRRFKEQLSDAEYQDLVAFEGNANGFKMLTETKHGVQGGLRLSYATLGAFMKYPKPSLPVKPTNHIADKKFGVFQCDRSFFEEVVQELGLLSRHAESPHGYARHPLTYLVEAADDICYTIIDFEDGINLGLIEEEFALEYLIKLVQDRIQTDKYHALTKASDRLAYLRSLAVHTLIQEAVRVFIENEESILSGTFSEALLDRSSYKAQIDDIIKISVEKVYQSKEVIDKEIAGYKMLTEILDAYTTAFEQYHLGTDRHYDRLLLQNFQEDLNQDDTVYEYLMKCCDFVARLTDGNALQLYRRLNGAL